MTLRELKRRFVKSKNDSVELLYDYRDSKRVKEIHHPNVSLSFEYDNQGNLLVAQFDLRIS